MNDQKSGELLGQTGPAEIDQLTLKRYLQEARDNQNLPAGFIAGVGAASIGVILWAAITAASNYQIGWMAVGVGLLVGFTVRQFGRGIDTIFGIVGAALSLLSCLAGNLFSVCITVSINPLDLLFYGIAIYTGYKFSFHTMTEKELTHIRK